MYIVCIYIYKTCSKAREWEKERYSQNLFLTPGPRTAQHGIILADPWP